jgi:hypothetical protein
VDRKVAVGGRAVPVKLLIAGLVGALLVAVAAALIARQLVSADSHPARKSSVPRGFVEFRDPRARLSLAYPKGWTRLQSLQSGVELLVARDDGVSFLLRTVALRLAISAENLSQAKRFTDKTLKENKRLKLLGQPQVVKLGGMPGFLYVYTFRDPKTRRTAAHAHYFVFRGRRMISLVFQALPSDRLTDLAPTFESIARTLRG